MYLSHLHLLTSYRFDCPICEKSFTQKGGMRTSVLWLISSIESEHFVDASSLGQCVISHFSAKMPLSTSYRRATLSLPMELWKVIRLIIGACNAWKNSQRWVHNTQRCTWTAVIANFLIQESGTTRVEFAASCLGSDIIRKGMRKKSIRWNCRIRCT